MRDRRVLWAAVAVAAILALVFLLWVRCDSPPGPAAASSPAKAVPAAPKPPVGTVAATEPPLEGESRLADNLNAPGGTIQRDLKILNELLETWQTNFPRDGNPTGENSEITAALSGANKLRFAFLPRGHRAVSARGELCDRWGTPFRFHAVGGHQMEIRSAGPDQKFGTADDAQWAMENAVPR